MRYLDKVESPQDIKSLKVEELYNLGKEIREYMLEVLHKTGGHVGPNLGSVELTLALHYVFDSPRDKIIWDVGHQAYPHKIITGRREKFKTIRQFGGISGFLKREESPHDIFGAGHASTALSAALGFAVGRDLIGDNYHVVAVVGDGALTGGMALEALNNIGHLKPNLIIILNDNEMSIAENVGALSNYLASLVTSSAYNRLKDEVWDLLGRIPIKSLSNRARETIKRLKDAIETLLVPTILFEELGIRYVGPLNGHDIGKMVDTFEKAKNLRGPTLIHILTKKGKGYKPAEENPELFHGLGPFDLETGKPIKKEGPPAYSKVYGETLVKMAEKNDRIVAITAAMTLGTGLKTFRERFKDRFFDVGIAEQHAVTFSAGLALQGLIPFTTIYSTFLQRAFDQIIHDVALQKIPVRFAIDRAGLVGEDGPTHHGAFDLSYLRLIPNMVVMAPKDENELVRMMKTAELYNEGPIAFRYPRGSGVGVKIEEEPSPIPIGRGEVLREGVDFTVIAIGSMVYPSLEAIMALEKEGVYGTLINARFVKPLDGNLILEHVERGTKLVVTVEENTIIGGLGDAVLSFLKTLRIDVPFIKIGIPDRFIEHGKRDILLKHLGLNGEGIKKRIRKELEALTKYAL